jgi:hypothetical protein
VNWDLTGYLHSLVPSDWPTRQSGQLPVVPNQLAEPYDYQTGKAVSTGNGYLGATDYTTDLDLQLTTAAIRNASGHYLQPSAPGSQLALQGVRLNADLTADLAGVYRYPDPRSYPLSAYSYYLLPTSATDPRMTTAKRQTLADFVYYGACLALNRTGPIGYASLPTNLITADLDQLQRLHQADPAVDVSQLTLGNCQNPDAQLPDYPQPAACTDADQGPCDLTGFTAPPRPTVRLSRTSLAAGDRLGITAGQFAVDQPYTVTVLPQGVVLAHGVTDSTGAIEITVALPADLGAGPHQLRLTTGSASVTVAFISSAPTTVASAAGSPPAVLASTGASSLPALRTALPCLVGGCLLLAAGRGRRPGPSRAGTHRARTRRARR